MDLAQPAHGCVALIHDIGGEARAVERNHQVGAGFLQRFRPVFAPGIVADLQADLGTAEQDRSLQRPRLEPAGFVEGAEGRQRALAALAGNGAALGKNGGVEDLPLHPSVRRLIGVEGDFSRGVLNDGAEQDPGRALGLCQGNQLGIGPRTVLNELFMQGEIADGVAGERPFGKDNEVGAVCRFFVGLLVKFEVAQNIPGNRVDLRHHYSELVHSDTLNGCGSGRAWTGVHSRGEWRVL